jgi:hypothetical protein
VIFSVPETVTGRICVQNKTAEKKYYEGRVKFGNIFNHIPFGKITLKLGFKVLSVARISL